MRTEISMPSAAALAAAYEAAPVVVIEELVRATWEAEMLLQREIAEATPVGASGGAGLRASIIAQPPRTAGATVSGTVGTPLSYAEPVELGTRPHRPPVQPLQDWVEAKLGLHGDEARGVAFAIAGKIAREGTKGTKMFGDTLERQGDQIGRIYERATARALDRIGGRQR